MGSSQNSRSSTQDGAISSRAGFADTCWTQLFEARIAASTERCNILDFLIRRYWKPVYCYLRRAGCAEEEAKDHVQEFFAVCLRDDFFTKADPKLGRFRNFLLTALKHFVANARRAALAQKRHPAGGFAFIDDSAFAEEHRAALRQTETPEEIYRRTWLKELVARVLKRLEQDCRASGKELHYQLFHRHLVAPVLEGATPLPLQELATPAGLTAKDAANRILTVQRAFRRLLKEEIRLYACSEEEVAEELRDLKRFLAR
ncbi:MAG TPA: hypothetical protein VGO11_25310 [Chthoniobacteraceae bacterium]|jgi:RNA polymerase sigma-70 factor (ECF subfamily)|nr:hypothetical protein [Chthoniobacteraceae bacterium]